MTPTQPDWQSRPPAEWAIADMAAYLRDRRRNYGSIKRLAKYLKVSATTVVLFLDGKRPLKRVDAGCRRFVAGMLAAEREAELKREREHAA